MLTNEFMVGCSCLIGCNGIYDVVCSFAMILWPNSLLGGLHMNIFQDDTIRSNPAVRRLMAHWVFIYGVIRVMVIFQRHSWLYFAVSITYAVEASYFEPGSFGDVRNSKAAFVSIACIALTVLAAAATITSHV